MWRRSIVLHVVKWLSGGTPARAAMKFQTFWTGLSGLLRKLEPASLAGWRIIALRQP